MDSIDLLGVRLHAVTIETIIEQLTRAANNPKKFLALYANIHTINMAQDWPWLQAFYNQADLVYCDGFGLLWGARLAGSRLPGRYTLPDWFPRLAEACAHHGITLFFLGGRPGVAEKAAQVLRSQAPNLLPVTVHHGYFDHTPGSPENESVLAAIEAAQPGILVVGMGMPLQERWITENRERLHCPAVMTVGAMLDYIAGDVPRAPRWMTDHGLEWLGRLCVEPRRLWKRYLVGNPIFFYRVLRNRIVSTFSTTKGTTDHK